MLFTPLGNAAVLKVAMLPTSTPLPISAPLSVKFTWPVGAGAVGDICVTVAVKSTAVPGVTDPFGKAARDVRGCDSDDFSDGVGRADNVPRVAGIDGEDHVRTQRQ